MEELDLHYFREIKLSDAYKILPFENEIVVLEISKEVLMKWSCF